MTGSEQQQRTLTPAGEWLLDTMYRLAKRRTPRVSSSPNVSDLVASGSPRSERNEMARRSEFPATTPRKCETKSSKCVVPSEFDIERGSLEKVFGHGCFGTKPNVSCCP